MHGRPACTQYNVCPKQYKVGANLDLIQVGLLSDMFELKKKNSYGSDERK